tara:strand:+ start:1280 stop:1456 length:177 start_codon:yes stop_codon:yes gene_type:complete
MTVEELLQKTSSRELAEWQAYLRLKRRREVEERRREKLKHGAESGAERMRAKLSGNRR